MQYEQNELKAEINSRFKLYDKVSITSDTYTVIDNTNGQIKLICDSGWCTTGSSYTYAQADSYLNGDSTSTYSYSQKDHGYEGRNVLKGKFSIPSTSDLQNVINGDSLDSRIVASSNGFWLNDVGSETNRQKYIDKNNSFLGENIIKEIKTPIVVNNKRVCEFEDVTEYGVLPGIASDNKVTDTIETTREYNISASKTPTDYWGAVRFF